jgi:hypothetical protein
VTTDTPAPAPPAPAARHRPNWGKRLVVGAVVAIGLLLLSLLGSAFIPRWWAQRIGNQVEGSFAMGTGVGLFNGFVFTALPLVVLWFTFHKRRAWKTWVGGFVGALILAVPNLMTLGIVIGRGSAAHAGERILDVEAPAFRNAVLFGAIGAVVVVGMWRYLMFSRHRTKRKLGQLRGELDGHRREAEAATKADDPA